MFSYLPILAKLQLTAIKTNGSNLTAAPHQVLRNWHRYTKF